MEKKYLLKDTTKSERIALIKEWEEESGCESSGMDLWEYFRDYIDGKKEISEINAEYNASYMSEYPEDEYPTGYRRGGSCSM